MPIAWNPGLLLYSGCLYVHHTETELISLDTRILLYADKLYLAYQHSTIVVYIPLGHPGGGDRL